MKRFPILAVLLALLILPAHAADPTIKDVMKRAHAGNSSLLPEIGRDLKADPPEWTDIQKHAREVVTLGNALGKNTPPKGDRDSWEKHTKAYVSEATVLETAAQNRDKAGVQTALAKLNTACKACHTDHQKK